MAVQIQSPLVNGMETDRTIYLSLAELRRRYRDAHNSLGNGELTEFELRCFSQHGEDGVIAEILARIGTAGGFFVEFGIEDGREGNCVFLADVLGWPGVFLESDDERYDALSRKYATAGRVETVKAMVTPGNIDELFARARVPRELDVLSIDVDGQDYWIWEALEAYQPRLVVIEYNASLPPGRQLTQPRGHSDPWGGTDFFGASLDALCALADRKGYHFVHTDLAASNAFFVRSDLVSSRFPSPDAVPRRHQPNYFMQGYRHPPDPSRQPYTDLVSGEQTHPAPSQVESQAPRPVHPQATAPEGPALEGPAPEGPPPGRPAPEGPAPGGPAPELRSLTGEEAEALAARTDFAWHQRFELAPGVYTPGVSDVRLLIDAAAVPERLDGLTVLDIGTTNGGAAFECERRGASRVVAVDIADENWFGFAALKEAFGSRVEHVQANIYELPELLGEQFDVVLFWGVLYHLRHPLLALDNVRRVARGTVSIETAVSDHELRKGRDLSLARFYRTDELAGDSSNWFAPNMVALTDWCRSAGLEPTRVLSWPERAPARAMVVASATEPEYLRVSYERPMTCAVAEHGAYFGTQA